MITPHFSLDEFHCRDGEPYPSEWIDTRLKPLCEALEVIRAAAGGVIHILSGYRTPEHNVKIKGALNSQHLQGRAADLICRNISASKLYSLIEKLIERKKIQEGGLGKYHSWVHYDQRGYRARWHETKL